MHRALLEVSEQSRYRDAARRLVGALRDEQGRARLYVHEHGAVTKPAPGGESFAWVEVLLLVYDEDLKGGEDVTAEPAPAGADGEKE